MSGIRGSIRDGDHDSLEKARRIHNPCDKPTGVENKRCPACEAKLKADGDGVLHCSFCAVDYPKPIDLSAIITS